MLDDCGHGDFVEAWLGQAPPLTTARERLELLARALDAVWRRAHETLGEITLAAIAERVVHTASARYAALGALTVERCGFGVDALRARAADAPPGEVTAWTAFVLTELLTVLGSLTAEVLTPPLRAALSEVAWTDGHGDCDDAAAPDETGRSTRAAKETKP